MKKPARRGFRKPTPERLANIALHYLSRFAASEASLRRVLENRLRRAAMQDADFAADREKQTTLRQAIDNIVEKHIRTGVLNDEAFAEMKARSLRRAGGSRRMIQEKLKNKGIAADQTLKALQSADAELQDGEGELNAALSFARKRRLGAFSSKPDDPDRRRKDMAALARAGFSSDVAREALLGKQPESLSPDLF